MQIYIFFCETLMIFTLYILTLLALALAFDKVLINYTAKSIGG